MTQAHPRAGCEKYRKDLSSFADHTLPAKRWHQVGYHLAGCAHCRDELAAIKRVCSTLSGSCAAPTSATPDSLAARLERIAGEASDAPLYMPAGPGGALPTRRTVRRRRIGQGSVAAISALASMFVLALLLAPDPPAVANPVHLAREEFSLSITAISVNEALGAVLLAHERGAVLSDPVDQRPRSSIVSAPRRISPEFAEQALSAALRADLTYSGVQRVWISDGAGAFYVNDVQIDEVAGEGSTLQVFDAAGDRFQSWFVPSTGCCASKSPAEWSFHEYRGMDQVAGRWAKVIEARDGDGHKVSRWWVDTANGLVLWNERYDTYGLPTLISGFVELDLDEADLASEGTELIVMNSTASAIGSDPSWCIGLEHCPSTLAGMPLVAHSSSDAGGRDTLRLVYSDGFRSVSVGWTQGLLDADGATRVRDDSRGMPEVEVWQSGDGVVSVATNGGLAVLNDAVAGLPGEQAWEPTLMDRLSQGLARMAGIN
ncbi:zf-HC2 domain-containing protein [Tessaracoccus sp. OS52]|uniref:zf-HC2 domain-containing protein n=1 Tax=Tessaracoccus sp. OS52 TaxID=2886691 RepID=UPI001D110AE0|nr:zf-HC2 domain-containing protein [Tessaracoccus sp. OS52]MCC2593494.1 zf-HC2 domain-containing protein [Tessaracoccus sp. OS52]